MLLLPCPTPILRKGDNLAAAIAHAVALRTGDIIAVSSKAVATTEGAAIDLTALSPSPDAVRYARATGRSAPFLQAVLDETERLHGTVRGTCPGALLTEVRPAGFPGGTILAANAGLDQSNIEEGFAIGWPRDPVASALELRRRLESSPTAPLPSPGEGMGMGEKRHVAVIITDSACRPRRRGVTAFALACAGIDPLQNEQGRRDLFDRELRITTEAVADQLATAANFLMGNAGQSVPVAVIRDHGIPFTNFIGWVPGIEPEEDLFRGLI